MKLKLLVTAGPHKGRQFDFAGHDTLLVGRAEDAHVKLSYDDPYFSRRHFLVEVNPPRCRVLDLESRNGMSVNGKKVVAAEVAHGDEISAGHTVFKVSVEETYPETQDLPAVTERGSTIDLPQASGLVVPGYQFGPELGRGAMGVVYRATRSTDGLVVAIKTIIPEPAATRRQFDRFLRECELLGRLAHPNIVGRFEAGEANGVIFLVMELVDGSDAASMLKTAGPLSVKNAIRLMCQVLGGLAHAHAAGIVHRDIKPANILIAGQPGQKRTAKIADFGLARLYEASQLSGLTMQGDIGGTPAYMAPEQVTHYRDVRPAADQYSAAATLYKLLTDHYLYDLSRDVCAALVQIVSDPPVPILDRRSDIPPQLAAVIHRALAREAKDRFENVLAFRRELGAFA